MSKKHFILDTNVLLQDPQAAIMFDEHTVVIPMVVLQELDKIKSQNTRDVCREARVAIRQIEDIVGDASSDEIINGVKISDTVTGTSPDARLKIFPDHNTDFSDPAYVQNPINDDIIINSALFLQKQGTEIVLVSNDINMRLKAKGCGIERVESYSSDKTVSDVDLLPMGYRTLDFDFWNVVGDSPTSHIDDRHRLFYTLQASLFPNDLMPNEYLYDITGAVLFRVQSANKQIVVLEDITLAKAQKRKIWGIHPKNTDQSIAIHSLMDPNQDLTVLLGPAGTGKTLITLAAALECVFEKKTKDKIIFTRSMQSQFEDIGFLPGNEHEKTAPWCGGALDNLEFLHRTDAKPAESVEYLLQQGKLQFRALNFIRGRSFNDTVLVIDEAQNLTASQVKTILTRAGENCKVVLLGNLAQIDNNYITPLSSGLTYAVEKMKEYEGSSVIQLQGVVRSSLADFAEKNL